MNKAKLRKNKHFGRGYIKIVSAHFYGHFLIIIPVSLVLIAYVGSYTHNKKVPL